MELTLFGSCRPRSPNSLLISLREAAVGPRPQYVGLSGPLSIDDPISISPEFIINTEVVRPTLGDGGDADIEKVVVMRRWLRNSLAQEWAQLEQRIDGAHVIENRLGQQSPMLLCMIVRFLHTYLTRRMYPKWS